MTCFCYTLTVSNIQKYCFAANIHRVTMSCNIKSPGELFNISHCHLLIMPNKIWVATTNDRLYFALSQKNWNNRRKIPLRQPTDRDDKVHHVIKERVLGGYICAAQIHLHFQNLKLSLREFTQFSMGIMRG